MRIDLLTIARIAEGLFALGLILVWSGILRYHWVNWPDKFFDPDLPEPAIAFRAISFTRSPLDDAAMIFSVAGICLIVLCGVTALALFPSTQKEKGIGVFCGLIISVTAWYLFRLEAKNALESIRKLPILAEDYPERHLWSPLMSNLVLTVIAIFLTHRNLLQMHLFDIDDETRYIVVKAGLLSGILLVQLYFTVMVYAHFVAGFAFLITSIFLAVGSLLVGRIFEFRSSSHNSWENKALLIP